MQLPPQIKKILGSNFFLLLSSALLFALSFPSSLLEGQLQGTALQNALQNGLPIFVFFFALPLLPVLLRLKNCREALFYGAFYGASSYLLLNLWLLDYDWIAFTLISGIYFYYFSVFFLAFYLIRKVLKLNLLLSYALFVLFWCILEYVKSVGWVAYTYGSLLYSHYQNLAAIQFSQNFALQNLAYVLILIPAICLHMCFCSNSIQKLSSKSPLLSRLKIKLGLTPRRTKLSLALMALCSILIFRYSFLGSLNTQEPELETVQGKVSDINSGNISPDYLNIALIQHNINSWQTDEDTSQQAFDRLIELSQKAEAQGAELIVWSETAFVPAYRQNLKRDPELLADDIKNAKKQLAAEEDPEDKVYIKDNLDYYQRNYREIVLSKQLKEYFTNTAKAIYIIGTNDYGQPQLYPEEKRWSLYNSMHLIKHGEIISSYHKKRLVPFTEESKWTNVFPRLNRFLRKQGFAQYSAGKTGSVLHVQLENKSKKFLRIYPLICYEDSIPLYWPHKSELPNFDIILSLSNDSWSSSPIGGLQHLSSALSRAVELRRYFLRASTSGQTTAIGPSGRLLKRLPANKAEILFFQLPLNEL